MTNRHLPVVVGYDGSDDAGLALVWGIRTAELERRRLRVVVAALSDSAQPAFISDHAEFAAQAAAASARDLVKSARDVRSEVVVVKGWPVNVLVRESAAASLVVVGSRGFGRIDGLWLGSVSQHLASHAAGPVAVVRPAHHPASNQILVGVDGSPGSVRALAYAAERARVSGESVLAVHASPFSSPFSRPFSGQTDAERLAAELIAGFVVDFPDVPIRSTAVGGRAGRVLARMADDASLVVVGSRGRNPFRELLLGSVSQEVLHRAACPVLIVR